MTNLLLPSSTVSNSNYVHHTHVHWKSFAWVGFALLLHPPVSHRDEYVKLRDMHSKTTLLACNSMLLTLNKRRNKRFTKRRPNQPFDRLTHHGSHTKTRDIYDSQHVF